MWGEKNNVKGRKERKEKEGAEKGNKDVGGKWRW